MDMCGARGSGYFRSWSVLEQGIALYDVESGIGIIFSHSSPLKKAIQV